MTNANATTGAAAPRETADGPTGPKYGGCSLRGFRDVLEARRDVEELRARSEVAALMPRASLAALLATIPDDMPYVVLGLSLAPPPREDCIEMPPDVLARLERERADWSAAT